MQYVPPTTSPARVAALSLSVGLGAFSAFPWGEPAQDDDGDGGGGGAPAPPPTAAALSRGRSGGGGGGGGGGARRGGAAVARAGAWQWRAVASELAALSGVAARQDCWAVHGAAAARGGRAREHVPGDETAGVCAGA